LPSVGVYKVSALLPSEAVYKVTHLLQCSLALTSSVGF
jgi:hypothetical protein